MIGRPINKKNVGVQFKGGKSDCAFAAFFSAYCHSTIKF